MEALYAKLYSKYTTLKKERETRHDELNRDQEAKFLNFAAAADEMIQYLKTENEKLSSEVDKLQGELASIRSSNDEHSHLQKLFMEEQQKNKEHLEEIARLQNLEHNKSAHHVTREKVGWELENLNEEAPIEASPKKHKSVHTADGRAAPCVDAPSIQQPVCCQRKIYSSDGDSTRDTCSVSCVFQHLVELVVGMKVSVKAQSNELGVLVHHQSSGYSFSLTWTTNSHGEAEMLYRVVSLGSFERVAPEWMKETLMFSTSMCSIFFERVSRVIHPELIPACGLCKTPSIAY